MLKCESTSCPAPTTRTRAVDAIGGIAAPLESKTTTSGPRSAASRAPSSTFETKTAPASPPPAAAAADRRHAGERGDLEVVGGGVPPRARELDEVGDASAALDHLRLGGPAAAHRDDDDVTVAREQRGEMRR